MKEVTLYTVFKEKRVVAQDHINFYERRYDSVPVYNLGGNTPIKESVTIQQIPVEHRVFYRRGDKQEYYIAMTEDVREVFGLELNMLNDYKTLCSLQEGSINKLNKLKKSLENELQLQKLLTEKSQLRATKYEILTFWQRLKFLFIGVLP